MDNTASKNNLLKLVRSLTQRVDQAKNENKQFRSRVNDKLKGFISQSIMPRILLKIY